MALKFQAQDLNRQDFGAVVSDSPSGELVTFMRAHAQATPASPFQFVEAYFDALWNWLALGAVLAALDVELAGGGPDAKRVAKLRELRGLVQGAHDADGYVLIIGD